MDYEDGDSREEEDELRSETLSRTDDEDGGPKEPAASKRDRLRKVLLPAIQSRVAALGGWEDVLLRPEPTDEDGASSSDVEQDENEVKPIQTIRVYKLGDECLGCLKDLKRFWRMDDHDDERNIARMFFETGVLKNDLVPILASYGQQAEHSSRQEKAALASADLIAAMTWPINAMEELREAELTGDKSTIDAMRKIDFSTLLAQHRAYKQAMVKSGAIGALFKMLAPRLQKGFRERTDRDENVINLILHIFRNLAAIEDRRAKSTASTEAIEQSHLQSDLICRLASENILDILITISSLVSKTEYNRFNTTCLEIFYLLFRGVERPDLLVRKSASVTKILREEKLGALLNAENSRKRMEGRRGVTRHSRFGTTVMIQNGKDRIVMHKQAAVASAMTNPGKVLDQDKRVRANRNVPTTNELSKPIEMRPEALKVLQAVAMSFLESSFNPFFESLLADIRMQRAKIKEVDNIRFLFLSRFFLEYFLNLYTYERSQGIDPTSEDAHDFDLVAQMTEPASIAFVCLRMTSALEEKPPLWTELHAGVDCFTQLLLVIEGLQNSGNEEYKEVAEILQDKLYYEGTTLDMVTQVASSYKNQPIRYLDTVINLVYVLLRMLEKYSKNKEYMYVKKKARRRANRSDPENEEMDEEEAEIEASKSSHKDHLFQFKNFESGFAKEGVMHTLLTYLSLYKEFSDEDQMKRVVSLLHRIAVKAASPQLFYKATILDLFKRVWDDRPCLPKNAAYNDLNKLISYVTKEFFKAAKEYPLLLVEIFFHSTKNEINKLTKGEASESEDDGFKMLKIPQDIIVKKKLGFSWSQEVGIAVALLTDMNRDDLISWVKDTLSDLAKSRDAVIADVDQNREAEIDAMEQDEDEDEEAFERRKMSARTAGPSDDAKDALVDFEVFYGEDTIQDAATRHIQLKLLLRLLKWECREADDSTHLVWTIPKALLPSDLRGHVKIIDDFLINPLDPENGLSLSEMVTKKAKPRKKPKLGNIEESSASDRDALEFSDPEAAAAIRGGSRRKKSTKSSKSRRRRSAADDDEDDGEEVTTKRRRAKRRKEAEEYRTAEFIEDSDVDDEADKAFFEREKRLREEMEKKSGVGNGLVERTVKEKKKKRRKKGGEKGSASQPIASQALSDDEDIDLGTQATTRRRSNSSSASESDANEPELSVAAKKPRPKARPKVGAVAARQADSSELENRRPAASSSSPEGDDSRTSLKRTRGLLESSDDDDGIAGESSPKQQATAASRVNRSRMIVASDDED